MAYWTSSGPFHKNWIKWAKVGNLDFTIDHTNVAGEMPFDWKGWVYAIKMLRGKPVAYGENGVSVLNKSDIYYGFNTVYRVGLKGKNAIAGDETFHYFIDKEGHLFSFGEALKKLDYSEYLTVLTDPVLSWDVENSLLYICDGTYGFVYSPNSESLGSGPINVTGIGSQGGTQYIVSPAAITTPVFEICTDIYDMGTRRLKTIQSLEFGIDLTTTLQASIDYRSDKSQSFSQTDWHTVDAQGFTRITCNSREFKFRARASKWEELELDYWLVNGEVLSH